jgi:hypothetical protein
MKILTVSIISLASIIGSALGNDNDNETEQNRLIDELIQKVNRQEERINKQQERINNQDEFIKKTHEEYWVRWCKEMNLFKIEEKRGYFLEFQRETSQRFKQLERKIGGIEGQIFRDQIKHM